MRRLREDYGLTQSIIAKATGASARTVRNWEQTSAIRPHNDERLRDLREVVLILRETLTARGVCNGSPRGTESWAAGGP